MGERLAFADIARARADDDRELDFPIGFCRALGDHDVVVRPYDAGRGLGEQHRLLGDRHAGFGRVVGVIEPDGNEIADMGKAWADPGRAAHRGQGFRLEFGEAGQRAGREHIGVDVRHHFAQVPQLPSVVDQRRLFLTWPAISCEFHKPSVYAARSQESSSRPTVWRPMRSYQTLATRPRQSLMLVPLPGWRGWRTSRDGGKLRSVPWISGWTNPISVDCFGLSLLRDFAIPSTITKAMVSTGANEKL